MRASFLYLKGENFGCLRTRQDQNKLHLKKWFFLRKSASRSIGFNPWTIELCMASYQGLYAKFVSIMPPKCSIVDNTFCHSSTVFGFSRFSLVYRRCFSSSKIRTQFSHTFCNNTMIFKVMLQYFPALFKRCTVIFVRRKDETNSLSNQTWAKCFTILEISTSWKKNVKWRTLYLIFLIIWIFKHNLSYGSPFTCFN